MCINMVLKKCCRMKKSVSLSVCFGLKFLMLRQEHGAIIVGEGERSARNRSTIAWNGFNPAVLL